MKDKAKYIPKSLQSSTKWRMQRRQFFKVLLAGAVATQIPWWMACGREVASESDFGLNEEHVQILVLVQDFLFPSDGNGPGANELRAEKYMQWVLSDENMDSEEKQYFINGLSWVEDTAQEELGQSFIQASSTKQNAILEMISKESWGESWYSMNLNFIFEALLSDPIYGANTNNKGWDWLEHNPGYPRPTKEMKYGNFLQYVNQETKS